MFSQFIYQFVLNTVLFSSLVLIAAIILTILFRKSAATVFACSFGGLLVAFLVPAFSILGNSINHQQVDIPVTPDFIANAYFQRHQTIPEIGSGATIDPETDSSTVNSVHSVNSSGEKAISESTSGSIPYRGLLIFDIAILVSIFGAALLLLRLVAAFIGVCRVLRKSNLVTGASHPAQRQLIAQLSQNRVTLRTCESLTSPVAVQWPTRAILVPDRFLSTTPVETIERVIEHERAHILRHDHATLMIQEVIASVFWFNPLVHVVKRIVNRAREDVCDNWVLAKNSLTDYCRDLIELGKSGSNDQLLAPGFIRSRTIAIRVRSLLNATRNVQVSLSMRMRAIIGISLLAVGSIAFFIGVSLAQNKETNREPVQLSSEELLELIQNFSNPDQIKAIVADRETGEPLTDAKVKLLHVNVLAQEQEILDTAVTNTEGKFEFRDLEQYEQQFSNLNLVVLVSHKGHSTQIHGLRNSLSYLQSKKDWQIRLGKAATLSGRITDVDGTPITGAKVWRPMFLNEPVDGFLYDQTGDDGRFEIKDHFRFKPHTTRDLGNGVSEGVSGTLMMVRHPEYGRKYFNVTSIPGNVNLKLEKTFAVSGRAIDKATGKPLSGLTVTASGHDHRTFENTKTNKDGKFEFALVPTTAFNVWVRHPDLDASAQTVTGASGQSVTTQDFELETLVTVKGIVLDDSTGKPFTSESKENFLIHWYGDARPETTSECKSAPIKKDGTFQLKVLPGRISPYIGNHSLIEAGGRTYKDGVMVTREKPVELLFRVRERK